MLLVFIGYIYDKIPVENKFQFVAMQGSQKNVPIMVHQKGHCASTQTFDCFFASLAYLGCLP